MFLPIFLLDLKKNKQSLKHIKFNSHFSGIIILYVTTREIEIDRKRMLLKCRYLSQFSVNEVAKNATNMYKAMEMCPFMAHARRTLVTTTSSVADIEAKPTMMTNELPRQQQQQQDQQVPIESPGKFLILFRISI